MALARRSITRLPVDVDGGYSYVEPPENLAEKFGLYVDPVNDIYYFDGKRFLDQAEFLTASGGTAITDGLRWQNYSTPDATNWITNGTFDENIDFWDTGNESAIMNHNDVDNTLHYELNGTQYNGPSQTFEGEKSKVYRITATISKKSGTPNPQLLVQSNGITSKSGLIGGTSTVTLNGVTHEDNDITVRAYANVGTSAIFELDNVSAYEVVPFKGYVQAQISGKITGTLPADVTTRQTLIALDADEDNATHKSYTYIDLEGGKLIYKNGQKKNGTDAVTATAIDLATGFTGGEAFELDFAILNGYIAAKCNEQALVVENAGTLNGAARMHLNRRASGTEFGNQDSVFAFYSTFTLPPGAALNFVIHHGDSYGGIKSIIDNETDAVILGTNIGGSTLPDAVTRALNVATSYADDVNTFWDGAANGIDEFGGFDLWMAEYQKLKDAYGDRIIVMPPIARLYTSSSEKNTAFAIQAALATMFGENYIDAQAIFATLATGSTEDQNALSEGTAPPSTLPDGVHPSTAAYQAVWDGATGIPGLGARVTALLA
jgi:hypothetical protein